MTDTARTSADVPDDRATIVIFGASGDLTRRKLVPALYMLFAKGFLPQPTPIVGVARREKSDEDFREEMRSAVAEAEPTAFDAAVWDRFAPLLHYRIVDLTQPERFGWLKSELEGIERSFGTPSNRVAYLATSPSLFLPVVEAMAKAGLIPRHNERPLPGQGNRSEHSVLPLRQCDFRAAVEPASRRPRADHGGRIAGHRTRSRRVL